MLFEIRILKLTLHINHANGLKEFQVKLNVPFACANLLKKFYIHKTIQFKLFQQQKKRGFQLNFNDKQHLQLKVSLRANDKL